MNIKDILELPMLFQDEELTIREYLHKLLITLWSERERFSGERPLGDSGWEHDLYRPLIVHGVVDGELDEYDCINTIDEYSANNIIRDCIDYCFGVQE